ncbi:MAG TPA: hypothetical protein VJ726_02385 [Candidatus Limnocylindria bacterium]|nr:hypothetical protein [Candidatus Limnocylindria bacterium]
MDRHELAWAAGFFDGEGWANAVSQTGRRTRQPHAQINQAGTDGMPSVLMKFQRCVGVGRLKGPLIKGGKQDLYWWEATSRPDVGRVADLIGPWLCPAKRAEFEQALGGPLSPATWPGSASEERAWAGGFFDGEGSTYLEKHRTHAGYVVPRLYVPQSAEVGVAPELVRLKSALADLGTISGVRPGKGNWRPYRRWRVCTLAGVQLGLHLLWPFIGDVKRSQAQLVMQVIHSQPDLPRGNPAFGVAGARYCLNGHDKWNARMRPFKGRGRNEEDPNHHLRQCLECVRIDARDRRARSRSKDRRRKRRRSVVT